MDFYLTSFPFVGSRLEVITANGVRYEGQLANADASNEQITLIKVTDYGTEDRRVMVPQPGNGTRPEHERLHLYDTQITSLKVLDELVNGTQPPPQVPQAPNNHSAPPAPPAPQVNGIGGGSIGGGVNAVNTGGGSSGSTPNDPRQPPQPAPASDAVILEMLKKRGVSNIDQLKLVLDGAQAGASLTGAGPSRQQPQGPGGDGEPATKQPRTADRLMEHFGHKERSPLYPLYSIAQLQQQGPVMRAIAVLFNAEECPKAPVYIRIDTQPLASAPVPTQVWRVRDYTWRDGGSARSCRLISRHYKSGMDGMGELEFARVNEGRPWLVNGQLAYQAVADPSQVELVYDVAEKKTRVGRIKAITSSSCGVRCVELDVKGGVSGFRLSPAHYHGSQSAFNRLKIGDEVEVDLIRLPVGCLVGARYVLPNVDFHRERPPFMPKTDEPTVESGTHGNGDYLPWKIKSR